MRFDGIEEARTAAPQTGILPAVGSNMTTIKFGTKVTRRDDSNRTEMLVANVSSTGGLVGCIWRLPGAWFSAGRFFADQLEVIGEYEPSAAQAMRMAYEQG